MPRDSNSSSSSSSISKSKPRGAITYPPFEAVDEAALCEIRRFHVIPFGRIHESCAHIPYNSGKKDFFVKTGRESFEVFKYEFHLPGDDTDYTVMWDYNVGLVRMTPFFKCCQYGKTIPAKMLGLNPGLKDITHSITGGAISAQGYWMPYHCAKAVCATFCYNIAGALIPIFGPDFPAHCTRPNAPDYGRMIIHPQLITEAAQDAEAYRRIYQGSGSNSHFVSASSMAGRPGCASPSPSRRDRSEAKTSHSHQEYRHPRRQQARPLPLDRKPRLNTRLATDSPYSTDTEGDSHRSAPTSASPRVGGLGRLLNNDCMHTTHLRPQSGWKAANHPASMNTMSLQHEDRYHHPSPWLSAVPRLASTAAATTSDRNQSYGNLPQPLHRTWSTKRPFDNDDPDYGYEGGESISGSSPATSSIGSISQLPALAPTLPSVRERVAEPAEKSAALLLMHLSVRDGPSSAPEDAIAAEGHRSKRRRATSM